MGRDVGNLVVTAGWRSSRVLARDGTEKREPRMNVLRTIVASFRHDDEGQGLAEYALILALIAIVAIVALIFLGGQVSSILSNVGNSV
jgi:pilus assembly protein Flp/PilA